MITRWSDLATAWKNRTAVVELQFMEGQGKRVPLFENINLDKGRFISVLIPESRQTRVVLLLHSDPAVRNYHGFLLDDSSRFTATLDAADVKLLFENARTVSRRVLTHLINSRNPTDVSDFNYNDVMQKLQSLQLISPISERSPANSANPSIPQGNQLAAASQPTPNNAPAAEANTLPTLRYSSVIRIKVDSPPPIDVRIKSIIRLKVEPTEIHHTTLSSVATPDGPSIHPLSLSFVTPT